MLRIKGKPVFFSKQINLLSFDCFVWVGCAVCFDERFISCVPLLEVFRVKFASRKVESFHVAGDSGRLRTHVAVEDSVARFGVVTEKPAVEGYWFLTNMDSLFGSISYMAKYLCVFIK